jgi:hypothetical protein
MPQYVFKIKSSRIEPNRVSNDNSKPRLPLFQFLIPGEKRRLENSPKQNDRPLDFMYRNF